MTPGEIELDYRERDGFQIGRAARLLDWQFRKDAPAFKALCDRLYQRNWQRRLRAEHPEHARANLRRWRLRNRERLVEQGMRRRREEWRANAHVNTCVECGTQWCPLIVVARKANWCSIKCRNRWHGRPRAKSRNRGIRNLQLVPTILAALAGGPLTLAELRAACPGVKPGSLASKLCTMAKAGELTYQRSAHQYARNDVAAATGVTR